jgi:8-oxo-dGTP pyrophosphatase MutT (NUDIX family)
MTESRPVKPAATVILLRQAEAGGFEVFLTRRPDDMPVLGGMYCYPGGVVTAEDCDQRMIKRCAGLTPAQAQTILSARLKPSEAIGFWIAAIREVFEEIGVLLAREESAARLRVDRLRAARLADKHAAVINKSLSFCQLLESEKLYCDLKSLAHFSHWQTPSQVAHRFATHFFIAALPPDQTPLATSYEVAHSVWLTPDRALEQFNRGELPLIFPTFSGLRTLADFATYDALLREFGLRQ